MSEDYPFIDGLTETTEADQHCYDELMSHAIPFSIHWENLDDSMKTFQWDSEWEKYIKQRAELFDYEGREKYLPWNLYKDLNLQWLDGYNYTQRIGNCCLPIGSLVTTLEGNVPIETLTGGCLLPSYCRGLDRVVLKKAFAYHTGRKLCVRVKTDKGSYILSDDHKVMLTNGYMMPAGKLQRGNSIKHSRSNVDREGYFFVHDTYGSMSKTGPRANYAQTRLHTLLNNDQTCVVHHKDGNRLNNSLANLQVMTRSEHMSHHGKQRKAKKRSDQDEVKKLVLEEGYKIINNSPLENLTPESYETCARAFYKDKLPWQQAGYECTRHLRQIKRWYGSIGTFLSCLSQQNDRVHCVEIIGELDSYDVSVEDSEADDSRDWTGHNFILCSEQSNKFGGHGIYVKNCGHAHKNALKASNLVNARQTGKTPREIALCIAYGIARGNGTMRMGSGLNLNPMARWSATVGNFWTADFGKYDGGRRASKWRKGSPACANALKTQSIPVYLPTPSFDLCYAACAAGFGINIGSGVYPTGSVPNGEGLATPSTWKNGGHAVALIAAWKAKSGRRYVYMENSHGARYAADSLNPNRQHGCWMEEKDIVRMASTKYGIWYVNLGELG